MASQLLDVVGWALPDLLDTLADLSPRIEKRPESYLSMQQQGAHLKAMGYQFLDGALHARYVRVRTRWSDVLSVMVLPTHRPDELPAFVSEWVVLKDRIRYGLVDLHPITGGLLKDRLAAELRGELVDRCQMLGPDCEVPEWLPAVRTPWTVVADCQKGAIRDLRALYQGYLAVAADRFYGRAPVRPAHTGENASVLAYKQAMVSSSFLGDLLDAKFGPDFAKTFLTRWHYGPDLGIGGAIDFDNRESA